MYDAITRHAAWEWYMFYSDPQGGQRGFIQAMRNFHDLLRDAILDATGTLDKLTSRYRSADDRHTSAENGASARVEETHNPSRDDISSASKARQSALNEHWQKSSKNDSKECKDGSKRQEASSHGTEKSVKERVRFAEDLVDQPRKSRWSSTVPKDSDEVRKEDRKDKPRLHGVVDGGDLITDTGIEPLAKKQRLKKEEKPARPPRPVYTDPMTEVWAQSWTKVWQKHREANRMETKCLVTKGDVSIASFMVSLAESELALIGQRIQAHEARLQQRERDGIVDDDLTVLPPSPPDDET
ncbi:hypothetical protein DYB32_005087 [Aphanomyces invadans]|uniref:Uncharacterized protein n=1 Tax=Aphanomyces invadans TaxID=157072 RepID=A0A418AVK5_9STRA|nr:hypothetical protein DYB32_005087 [Aphanomyces invadans]